MYMENMFLQIIRIRFIPFLFLVLLLVSCRHTQKSYYENGELSAKIQIKNGRYHGQAMYYYEDGTIQMVCHYQNNLLDGPMVRYWPNGAKKESYRYVNNKLEGDAQTWDQFSELITETSYRDSLLNGSYKEYYPSGNIKVEGQYVSGNFDGKWMYYDEYGYIIGIGEFSMGTGVQKAFDSEGRLRQQRSYKNNLKDGLEQIWLSNGIIAEENWYEAGNLVRKYP